MTIDGGAEKARELFPRRQSQRAVCIIFQSRVEDRQVEVVIG